MTNSPEAPTRHAQDERERLYRALARDARYGHYVRIPERICRCLDYFKVASERRAVKERLHSYYLFIGVVDDLIDSGRVEVGREILEQLGAGGGGGPSFDEETKRSRARLVTEVLQSHISPEIYPPVLGKLEELYRAVVGERESGTMRAYIVQRKAVGRLTSELSYLLIRPLLGRECVDLSRFLQEVGEVGCLIDSTIDLRHDGRLGLLSFRPTLRDHLRLAARTLREGLTVSLSHPRLSGLFLEGLCDDLFDRLRARPELKRPDPSDGARRVRLRARGVTPKAGPCNLSR
ncbi:MAG: hypothetical protein H0T60_19800 [Acidobacteria bacterium]|nr:hypothetical protein [Acidobacteriota bacterium]